MSAALPPVVPAEENCAERFDRFCATCLQARDQGNWVILTFKDTHMPHLFMNTLMNTGHVGFTTAGALAMVEIWRNRQWPPDGNRSFHLLFDRDFQPADLISCMYCNIESIEMITPEPPEEQPE